MKFFWAILWLLLLAPGAIGQVSVSSPVGGYYRVGKFTPLQIENASGPRTMVYADGTVRVRIMNGGASSVTVPLLVIGPTRGHFTIAAAGGSQGVEVPMRALGEDERLVALVGDVTAADAQFLFPGKTIVPVKLDRATPFPGSPLAWEVFDGIVCDAPPGGITNAVPYRQWLGSAVTIAVRFRSPPDTYFAWDHRGRWWVLRYEPSGPLSAVDSVEAAHAPAHTWAAGASLRTRATVLAMGAVLLIVALAASLIRDRFFVIAALVIVVAGSLGVGRVWSQHLPHQRELDTAVAVVTDDRMFQYDLWMYRAPVGDRALVDVLCVIDSAGRGKAQTRTVGRPTVTSAEQAARQRLTLEVEAGGQPQRWTARLFRGERLAVLTRLVDPLSDRRINPYQTYITSPTASLVREAYLAPGVMIIGQGSPRGEDGFPEVFVRREEKGK